MKENLTEQAGTKGPIQGKKRTDKILYLFVFFVLIL